MNREQLRARIIVACIYAALLALICLPSVSFAAIYDPQQAKGFPRLSDKDSITVPLYSFYENGDTRVDAVRFPKQPPGAEVEVLACVRLAPSAVAQCVFRLKTLGATIAQEVPLNIVET